MSFEVLPPTPPRPLYRWVPVCPDHEAIETCPACALAAARRESARLSAELADARGWLREHAKWACGHISEGTGGEPEACRICAVQDSESEARRALEATGAGTVALTDVIDGHSWVTHADEVTGIAWCQWCGGHRGEVPDWTDNPQCPAFARVRAALAAGPDGPR